MSNYYVIYNTITKRVMYKSLCQDTLKHQTTYFSSIYTAIAKADWLNLTEHELLHVTELPIIQSRRNSFNSRPNREVLPHSVGPESHKGRSPF